LLLDVVLVLVLCPHEGTIRVDRLQIPWSLLIQQVSLNNLAHVVPRQLVSVHEALAIWAIEPSGVDLTDEGLTNRAFLGGVKLVYTHDNVSQ
jgi:hypothetical protein